MKDIKKLILDEIQEIKRKGTDDLIDYLEENRFFVSPASSTFHSAFRGGLAHHSWYTFECLKALMDRHPSIKKDYDDDSIRISGILHDICKANAYKLKDKWVKDEKTDKWIKQRIWAREYSDLPLGHGEKSVIILTGIMKLKPCEQLAIRWHMGAFTPGVAEYGSETHKLFNAAQREPLVTMLYLADLEATFLLEENGR